MTIPGPPGPPRRAERLLRWSLSPDDRQPQLGDLQEEFATLAERGPAAARRWYWRQALTSVVPNVLRRIRHGWHLISRVVDERDRTSRRWRRWGGAALVAVGIVWGVGLSISKGDWSWFEDGLPAVGLGLLIGLTSLYRLVGPSSRSRRMLLFNLIMLPNAVSAFVEITRGEFDVPWFRFFCFSVQGLVWFWPRGTWPFRRPVAVTSHSLRSPLLVSGPWGGWRYDATSVSNIPLAMSDPILGLDDPVIVPPELRIDGLEPVASTVSREFHAFDRLRLFAVVAAAPEDLSAAVEIRRSSTGRLLGHVPANVGLATPFLTRAQKFAIDQDDEPLAPSPVVASDINAVVSLAGLAPGDYTLRVVAHHADESSFARVDITVLEGGGRR